MLNFAVVRLSLCVLLGVVLGFYFRFPVQDLLLAGAAIFILFLIAFLRSRRLLFPDVFFGILTFSAFIFLGIFSTSANLPENRPKHYINNKISSSEELVTGRIVEKLKPTNFQDKFVVTAMNVGNTEVEGKFLLNIDKDVSNENYKIGDIIGVLSQFSPVNPPLNPHQFDYSAYLENQKILRQINISPQEIFLLKSDPSGLLALAGKIRERIIPTCNPDKARI